MVLAPEHPLVDRVTTADRHPEVEAYREEVARMDLVARKKVDKSKTGVFTGGHCENPATGERTPIWIADYVLMEYGTGAVMAVPGHDERDFEFATVFGLPIRRVVAGAGEGSDTPLAEALVEDGTSVNSGTFSGMPTAKAKRAIVEWLGDRELGEHRVTYRLHDWCISRQRYWGPPIPIVHCDGCGPVAVPDDQLPVILPRVEDFTPDDSGVSPLARGEEWYRTSCPECGRPARRETDVSDTFPGLGLVLPAVSIGRQERRSVRSGADSEVAPRELLHRRERARGAPPPLRPDSSRWRSRRSAGSASRNRSLASGPTASSSATAPRCPRAAET